MLTAVASYVAVRRAAGFAFKSEALLLKNFANFSEVRAESYVRASLAIEWTDRTNKLYVTPDPAPRTPGSPRFSP